MRTDKIHYLIDNGVWGIAICGFDGWGRWSSKNWDGVTCKTCLKLRSNSKRLLKIKQDIYNYLHGEK